MSLSISPSSPEEPVTLIVESNYAKFGPDRSKGLGVNKEHTNKQNFIQNNSPNVTTSTIFHNTALIKMLFALENTVSKDLRGDDLPFLLPNRQKNVGLYKRKLNVSLKTYLKRSQVVTLKILQNCILCDKKDFDRSTNTENN
ncbi:hypothetical protein WH47_09101 [Habropoda laboriosa]|uniref:Uncharacterized protein n=1 Tax=Habropoda laboriosa TaxID=597456 RepID=A0A0L7RGF2_9HYME|nr:hypothetical protein WH47_09101 [Habropoda laboriosa]